MKNIQLQLNWLSQCVFKASFVDSDCLLYIIGQEILCQRNTSFKQYIEKTWHDSNSSLEYVHNHMLPALVAQCMVTARLHHDVNVMDVARNPARLKQRGHQVHTIIISWGTQITPENCPLGDEYSPQHPSELSACERHSKTVDCTVTDDFFLLLKAWDCTATSSFFSTCGLSYQLSSKSHKIQHILSSSGSVSSQFH